MIELSPAGQMRERSVPCAVPGCLSRTWNHSRLCSFHLPDSHEAWVALHEAQEAQRAER